MFWPCNLQVHDVVMVMDESLRPAACQVATALRQAGHVVDVVLEAKKMKQVFKVCSSCCWHFLNSNSNGTQLLCSKC